MNKKDEWITRAVHVLRRVEFGGTELDYETQTMSGVIHGKTRVVE